MGFALLIGAVFLPTMANASRAAEAFIRDRAVKVVAVLNSAESIERKRDELSALVDENVDIQRIAYYTLGSYRASANAGDLDRYVAAFKDYLFAYYIKPAAGFSGIALTVTGTIDLPEGRGSLVQTVAKTPSSVELDWYVLGDSSIVDVEIAGFSAAKLLRAQVIAVLALNGGKISAATSLLETLVKRT